MFSPFFCVKSAYFSVSWRYLLQKIKILKNCLDLSCFSLYDQLPQSLVTLTIQSQYLELVAVHTSFHQK